MFRLRAHPLVPPVSALTDALPGIRCFARAQSELTHEQKGASET
jgi:hypothetical protein